MANEAVKVEGPYEVHDFTVANGTSGTNIEQGTIMKLSDPRTCAASSGASDAFAGILATEKVGGNGKTEIGCYTRGIFDLTTIGPAITAGDIVSISGANLIKEATEAEIQAGKGIGKALESSTAGSEVIEVFVGQF